MRRTPRRTTLTVLGIAASLTVLVGFLGIMDSVFDAVDTAETESAGTHPDRVRELCTAATQWYRTVSASNP